MSAPSNDIKGIPDGLTKDLILQAISDIDKGETDGVIESTKYDLVHNGKKYPPKSVVRLAIKRLLGRDTTINDFPGGLDTKCFRVLEQHGFQLEAKAPVDAPFRLPLQKGQTYKRSELHDVYGGSRQSGISRSASHPVVFIFTGHGDTYGYPDQWLPEGIFLYSGEGQTGDMTFERGNAAILNHINNGQDLWVFEMAQRAYVKCLGQFVCTGYREIQGPDVNGNARKVIQFELTHLEELAHEDPNIEAPSTDLAKLKALAEGIGATPQSPKERKQRYYQRSLAVKQYALVRANGICEACNSKGPFIGKGGMPYLEVHHLTRMSDGGPDLPANVAAICPNCHRHCHAAQDSADYNNRLISNVKIIETR